MVARMRDLPAVSMAALHLVTLLGDNETGIDDAIQVIKQDTTLTAKLLRACNSPCLGLEEPVSSVNQAVLLLGHKRVYNMVMAMSLRSPLDVPLPAYAMEASDLWRHSLLAATAAEMAVNQGLNLEVDNSTAFTVGLLHDIGKLITNQFLTRQSLTAIRYLVERGQPAIEAEKSVLGTDHAEVGAALCYIWGLPDFLVEAIGLHHTPPSALRLSALAYFADWAAHQAESVDSCELPRIGAPPLRAKIFEALGFDEERLHSLVEQVLGTSIQTNELLALSC